MTRSSAVLDMLLADPGRFAGALSGLLLHAATLVTALADRTEDPAWRAVIADLDQLVARLRELAATTGPPPALRACPTAPARSRLVRRGRMRRPPRA
jgi:hypothetical protein